jgi:hypothetical protein
MIEKHIGGVGKTVLEASLSAVALLDDRANTGSLVVGIGTLCIFCLPTPSLQK